MVKAQRFDGLERTFDNVNQVVDWVTTGGALDDWKQDGDYIKHTGIPGKCGTLTVCSDGVPTDAHIGWWKIESSMSNL